MANADGNEGSVAVAEIAALRSQLEDVTPQLGVRSILVSAERLAGVVLAAAALCAVGGCIPIGAPAPSGPGVAGDGGGPSTTDAAVGTDAGLLSLGEPCAADDECLSGLCNVLLQPDDDFRCIADCDVGNDLCPESGFCLVPGAAAGICVPTCPEGDCPPGLSCEPIAWADVNACTF